MFTKLAAILIFFAGLLVQGSNAQDVAEVRITCTFDMYGINVFFGYTCLTSNITFDFSNPFYYIVIDGEHTDGRTNDDVTQFAVANSALSSIPANIFQVFPNLEAIEGFQSGITSITPPNFTFSRRLRGVFITFNNMPGLFASPFMTQGATITHVSLYANQIQAIGGTFFNGLANLRYLSLANNNLQAIAPQVMTPLVNLREFLASSNALETLHARLFERNVHLEVIGLEYNNINAVGPNIFNDLPNLDYVGLSGNRCIDGYFDLQRTPIDDVNEALQECFVNSPPEPARTRNLLFELRGNMSMFDEYNEQILNVQGRAW